MNLTPASSQHALARVVPLLAGAVLALWLLASCQSGPPTGELKLGAPAVDRKTGTVTINGVDTNRPDMPFTWSWGDGKKSESFFPATHTYADRAQTYTVTVTAHYPGNHTATAKTVVAFQ